MMVCPAAEDELEVPVEVVELDELLELELQAARSVAVATAAATAVVARRETQPPARVRLRSAMEPPRGCLRAAARAGAGCGDGTPGVPCQENRSDVCWCQCPESPRNTADTKQIPGLSSDLCDSGRRAARVQWNRRRVTTPCPTSRPDQRTKWLPISR